MVTLFTVSGGIPRPAEAGQGAEGRNVHEFHKVTTTAPLGVGQVPKEENQAAFESHDLCEDV